MNAEQLAGWLEATLPAAPGLTLDPERIRVSHVLNWGGFVNHSFSVDDGSARYHLKITDDAESARKLRAWYGLRGILERRYGAPEIVAWMDFPEVGFAGLLQRRIDGRTAKLSEDRVLVQQLIDMASRLHADRDLRSRLKTTAPEKTYLDHFVETYIDRFDADLEALSPERPPFVSPSMMRWMREETDRLRADAASVEAFHERAREPVHGDLNEGNVLVTGGGWFVVDWDDLAIGDPAIEFAVLLWSAVYQGISWHEFSIPGIGPGFMDRIEVCFRAQLLDEVIDPLADYVAAGAAPSRQLEVQRVKRERHEEALEKYRSQWCR